MNFDAPVPRNIYNENHRVVYQLKCDVQSTWSSVETLLERRSVQSLDDLRTLIGFLLNTDLLVQSLSIETYKPAVAQRGQRGEAGSRTWGAEQVSRVFAVSPRVAERHFERALAGDAPMLSAPLGATPIAQMLQPTAPLTATNALLLTMLEYFLEFEFIDPPF